ncbi:MAG TPA: FAD binding domain-containing protein, partial [Candidatus Methylomirabilis sp.]|nr:FAD binding domain-containing protein [Candidatus Methylomirabilis sp.]
RNLLVNIHGRELAWQFIKTHWETMQGQYPLGGLRRMCEGITALTTPALEEDVRQFFASKKISLGGKTLEQYLEQLHVAVVFCERETANLTAYLRAVGRVDGPAGSCYLTQLSVPRFHGSLPHTGTGKGVLGAGLSMTNAEYFSPETLDEAAALLLAAGSQIRIQAEGTTLIVAGSEGERTLSMVLDLKRIPELNRIDYDERNGLRIGAAVPFRTILDFPPVLRLYPMLADATPPGAGDLVDQSTLGGSLGHQADAAEMAPPLICLRASAAIFGPYGWSEAGTEAWLTSSGGIVLQPGEFVVDLRFPALPPRSNGAYLRKTSQERADTVAGVGAFVVLEQDLSTCCGARLTVWGAAPTPLRVLEAERFLAGKVVGDAVLQKAGNLVARCALPVDGRMGASFHLVEELARGAIGEALGRVRKSHKL